MYRDEDRRRAWHCGWIDREEWVSPHQIPTNPVGAAQLVPAKLVLLDEAGEKLPEDKIVCPGWLVVQDEVIEGARAYRAFDKGVLTDLFPNLEHAVGEAAEFFAGVAAEHQDAELKRAKNGG